MTTPRNQRRALGIYRRVYPRIWRDEKFRALTRPVPSAQWLWVYLLTGSETIAAPGVVAVTPGGLGDQLDWSRADVLRCFDEIAEAEMAVADWDAGVVLLPNAAFYNPPASTNAVKTWASSMDLVPECDLKLKAINHLAFYLLDYSPEYQRNWKEAFPEAKPVVFREAKTVGFPEAKRYPGAGTGTGSGSGYPPIPPFSSEAFPPDEPSAGADPAPLHGAAGSSPASAPRGASEEVGQGGDARENVIDVEEREDSTPDSTGIGEEGFRLEEPEIPTGSGQVGCTVCRDRVPGLVFRRAGPGRFEEQPIAAFCWGCASLGARNTAHLPMPEPASRRHWKRFEHAFPEQKRLRKRDRERFAGEAIARTKKILESRGAAAEAARKAKTEQAARAADLCGHCGLTVGLVFRDVGGAWLAGLCPECGGSTLYAAPPKFMGPPIGKASVNGGWVPWAETPAAAMGDADADAWRQAAVKKAKTLVQGEPVPEPEGPVTDDGWDDEPDEPETGSSDAAPSAVSGEPPPL